MADRTEDRRGPGKGAAASREDRLRAALRANLQRRKAQARARDRKAQDGDPETGSETGKDDS